MRIHSDNEDPDSSDNGEDSQEADNGAGVDRLGEEQEEQKVFRDYANACDRVKLFYAEQHAKQTMEYNIKARTHFRTREKLRMSVWDAIEKLNELVDDSDPDVSSRYYASPYLPD